MSDFVSGIVTKINSKPTRGNSDIWSICVDCDGDEDWYGYGFEKPDFGEGSEVEFDIEWNGDYANVDNETFEVIELVEARKKSSRGGAGRKSSGSGKRGGNSRGGRKPSGGGSRGGKSGGGKSSGRGGASKAKGGGKADVDWDRKDKLIRLQSCQNTAIAFISAAVTNGSLKLPAAKGKGFDAFAAAVEEEAERLFGKYDDIADNGYQSADAGGDDDDDGEYDDE